MDELKSSAGNLIQLAPNTKLTFGIVERMCGLLNEHGEIVIRIQRQTTELLATDLVKEIAQLAIAEVKR